MKLLTTSWLWISLCIAHFYCPSLAAVEIVVHPHDNPLATPLKDAIKKATAGDVILIQPGVYNEFLIINKSLTLRGEPGAILRGSQPFTAKWSQLPDHPGVYVAKLKKRARGLLVDGKFVAELNFDRTQKSGDWHWQNLLSKGPPLSGFSQIRALWLYNPQSQQVYARFSGAQSPGGLKIDYLRSGDSLIHVIEASQVIIEGLTFEQARAAITLNRQAQHCIVRHCKILSYESTGIILTGGASNCLIEKCDITRGSLEDWAPSLKPDKANYEIWRIHKDAGYYDRNAINLFRAGSGNRILSNHLHHVFDGVSLGDFKMESLDIPLSDPDRGRDTEIAHNIIEKTRDSGIELGTGCINVNVHHNLLRRTHGGLRFKLPRIGPLYIHHNRLISGSPFNFWFSMDASPAEAYVYHNTVVGGREFLFHSSDVTHRGFLAPKWHFYNNLSLDNQGFCRTGKNLELDFTAAGNISSGAYRPWSENNKKDQNNRYQIDIAHDQWGAPAKNSTAVDAGIDLSTYLKGRILPGCARGYHQGKAPDIGAVEIQ